MDWNATFRILARRPALTLMAIATTALAVGANTAIFSVARAVFLRPLGYPAEDRLVEIRDCNEQFFKARAGAAGPPRGCISASAALYRDFQEQAQSFESLGARNYDAEPVSIATNANPILARAYSVTASFFRTVAVAPALGRWFDELPGGAAPEREVILSYALWQGSFGGDPGIVGKEITVADAPHRVAAVMPAGFSYPSGTQLWLPHPYGLPRYMMQYGARNMIFTGRLKPGVSLETAQAEANAIARRAEKIAPEMQTGWTPLVNTIVNEMTFAHKRAFVLISAAVGLLLLIACANLSNLLLAGIEGRAGELAMRTALGARRRDLVKQILGESLVLSVAGGILGLVLMFWGIDLLRLLIPSTIPRGETAAVDWAVALFSLFISLAAGLAFGLFPALRASSVDLGPLLRASSGTRTTRAGLRARSALVTVQVALAVVLLSGAGLLLRTMKKLAEQNLGFRSDQLLIAQIPLSRVKYGTRELRAAFSEELLRNVSDRPGVIAAGAGWPLPFTGDQQGRSVLFEGQTGDQGTHTQFRSVTPGFFASMGIPVIDGRDFNGADQRGAPPVAILNQTLARIGFGDRSPVGKRIKLARDERWIEVVGVVPDCRHQSPDRAPGAELYMCWLQDAFIPKLTLSVRFAGPPAPLISALRPTVARIDPNQPLGEVALMNDLIQRSTNDRRFPLVLLSIFSVLAMGIAAVGIYGVVSHSVAERTNEMAVRFALGANQGSVLRMLLFDALRPVAAGLAAGLILTIGAARFLDGLLYNVQPYDPVTLVVCAVLALASFAASIGPALRACRTNPLDALRAI